MYEIVKNVLNRGGYNLTAMANKIDSLWVQGKFSDNEYNQLMALAREGAKTEDNIDLLAKMEDFDKRLSELEKTTYKTVEYPEYQSGKWYHNGDKCSFGGINYICTVPNGIVCVWSPKDYPTYWEISE